MKIYKHVYVVFAVSIFITPHIVFAAWWNPLSWSVWNFFRRAPQTQQVQISTTTATTSRAKIVKKAMVNVKQDTLEDNKNSPTELIKRKIINLNETPYFLKVFTGVAKSGLPISISLKRDGTSLSGYLLFSSVDAQFAGMKFDSVAFPFAGTVNNDGTFILTVQTDDGITPSDSSEKTFIKGDLSTAIDTIDITLYKSNGSSRSAHLKIVPNTKSQ